MIYDKCFAYGKNPQKKASAAIRPAPAYNKAIRPQLCEQSHKPIAQCREDIVHHFKQHCKRKNYLQTRTDDEREERANADLYGTSRISTIVHHLANNRSDERTNDCAHDATHQHTYNEARRCATLSRL